MNTSATPGAHVPSPRVMFCANDRDLAIRGADILQDSLKLLPHPTVLAATGKTCRGLYVELAARHPELSLGASMRVFALDEYLGISPDHPQSFRQELLETLIHPLGLSAEQLETPHGDSADPETEALRYEQLLVTSGDADVAVLGVGRNGHIAFNEPGTPATSKTHVARLSGDTLDANAASWPANRWPPPRAITVGIATILRSRRILIFARGAEKAAALAALFQPTPHPAWPISALRDHPDVIVCVDEAAGSRLGALDGLGQPVHPMDDF